MSALSHRDREISLFAQTPLYPLPAIGAGTANVESLTGYISRLAQEHFLLISDFLDVPCLKDIETRLVDRRTRRRLFHASCYQIDGSSIHSPRWIVALEPATGIYSLRHHTILPFVNLSSDSWLRAWKAWCPLCYDEWRMRGNTLYDPLLWSIKAVTVCPTHLTPIVERCPVCHQRYRPLVNGYVVGKCGRCHSLLGKGGTVLSFPALPPTVNEFEIWAANEIGTLLASIPSLLVNLDSAPLRNMLLSLIERNPLGNVDRLAACLGMTRRSITTWSSGEVRPRLVGLCRLSFQLRVPLLELIQGLISPSEATVFLQRQHKDTVVQKYSFNLAGGKPSTLSRDQSLAALVQAADLPFPPTVHTIAKQLGLAGASLLRRRHPDACRDLHTKRNAASLKKISDLKFALENTLLDDVPHSPKQIAMSLGIREEFLKKHFPELKIQLRDRYLSWRAASRQQEMERIDVTVKKTVQGIRDGGEYPSAGRVLERDPSLRSAGWDKLQQAILKACNK